MNPLLRCVLLGCAWLCLALGAVGTVVPVLPTTPFVLLALFLFARTSPRLHDWLTRTRIYRSYVLPYRNGEGLSRAKKARMLAVSLAALALSAALVQYVPVWIVLGCVAAFLCWLVFFHIPTVRPQKSGKARAE